MKRKTAEIIIFLITVLPIFGSGAVRAEEMTFGNDKIGRAFNVEGGVVEPILIENRITGEQYGMFGPEFEITLMDGTVINSSGMKAEVKKGPDSDGAFELEFASDKLSVTVEYSAAPGEPLRKKLRVCGAGPAPVTVDSVAVESSMLMGQEEHGGMGQPLFLGDIFIGLESPVGYNIVEDGVMKLKHYPGWTLKAGECGTSYTEVMGASEKGQIDEAFRKYVDSIRHTVKSNLLYNSWYDVRADKMSVARFEEVYEGFRKGLGANGMKLDYLVVDDGWQAPDSIWGTMGKSFPDGFSPLRKILEKGGTELGIWLPLTGYGLNVSWGEKQGYETSENNHHYCMAGPKFNEAMRERLKTLVLQDGARYFKHDFNFISCFSPRTSYPQTERHSFEANVNAEIGLLDYLHSLNPDVYLNVTSYLWLSPWWLPHADTLWIGSNDYGYEYSAASLEPRDWAMTYNDSWMHKRLAEEELKYPTNAIMTHGIIDGTINRLGGKNEIFRTWADNVIMYFGRGVYMRELYISPELMDARKWAFLSQAAKWAKWMDPVFARTEWIGGDPRKGEAYGYHHFGAGQDWFVLRNPGMEPRMIELPISDDRILQQVYPRMRVSKNRKVALGGHDVVVIRAVDENEPGRPAPLDADYEQSESSPAKTVYMVYPENKVSFAGPVGADKTEMDPPQTGRLSISPANPMQICSIAGDAYVCEANVNVPDEAEATFYAAFYANDSFMMNKVEIDGKTVETQTQGKGWRLFPKPVGSGTGRVVVRIPASFVREAPFAAEISEIYRFTMYLESEAGERPVRLAVSHKAVSDSVVGAILPPLRDPGSKRALATMPDMMRMQTLDFGAPEFSKVAPVSDDDLKGVTAAKLRIRVFGSDRDMKYMLLNGAPVGVLPVNDFPFDFWDEFIIDIPPNALKILKKKNKFTVNNMPGDDFKFNDAALSVRLADGSWRSTGMEKRVQSSNTAWKYSEGTVFSGISKPVTLEF